MHPLNGKNIWEFKKAFHLFPLGRAKLSGVFENFFVLQKTPSLIWTKGAEMHTHFRTFSRKFFEKNSPFTYSHCEKPNAHPISKNLSLHLFGIWVQKRNLSFRKNRKNFFEKIICIKNIPSLVPTGRGCLGTVILKKAKKFAHRKRWAVVRL